MLRRIDFLLDFLFPPICLHCEAIVENSKELYCKGCSAFFELIDPSTRCPYCFYENGKNEPCQTCVRGKRWQVHMASAVDYVGAVSTHVKKMKQGRVPYLAKTAAAFMTVQFLHLNWPKPDWVVPVPRRFWWQNRNHSELIALEVAKILRVPYRNCLKRVGVEFSQSRLDQKQRESLAESTFLLRSGEGLEEANILLVDDVITTGTTLRHSALALREGFPKKIFALSFARSISYIRQT